VPRSGEGHRQESEASFLQQISESVFAQAGAMFGVAARDQRPDAELAY
jgi:hypothetical protein